MRSGHGALGSVDVERATFVPQLADWFEQFSTAVLILPFIPDPDAAFGIKRFRFRQLLPVLALVLSIALGVAVTARAALPSRYRR